MKRSDNSVVAKTLQAGAHMKEVVFLGGKSIGASCLENLLKRRSDLGYEVAPVFPTPEGEQVQGIEVERENVLSNEWDQCLNFSICAVANNG